MTKYTTEYFIECARKVHGDKYDYSRVRYERADRPVCIICPEHGEFWQTPHTHLLGHHCPKCGRLIGNNKTNMSKTTFVSRAQKINGDKYDYTQVEYKNNYTKVLIICPVHGGFWQRPSVHLKGQKCPKCSEENGTYKPKKDTQQFIEDAKRIHCDKYDYSKVNYVQSQIKVCIICPEHGEFWQKPNDHLNGKGCPKCGHRNSILKRYYTEETTEDSTVLVRKPQKKYKRNYDFIGKARAIHGDKYDYSLTEYVDGQTPVTIICPTHGPFLQKPSCHLNGSGCQRCVRPNRSNREDFIEKARKVHGDKYNYDKVVYVNSKTRVIITCPEHGDFLQQPAGHIFGYGCSKCNRPDPITQESFIERSRTIHRGRYDYSRIEYVDANTPVCIICPTHGEFWQSPTGHLKGNNCPICAREENGNRQRLSKEVFIERARLVHKDRYNYDKVVYKRMDESVCITCPVHGDFWQKPEIHLSGCGCKRCRRSVLEESIAILLQNADIEYFEQQTFPWLGRQSLDFFIPSIDLGIECQGKQHFRPVRMFGGEEAFIDRIERDMRKKRLCGENGVKLVYYSEPKIMKASDGCFNDKSLLLEYIQRMIKEKDG